MDFSSLINTINNVKVSDRAQPEFNSYKCGQCGNSENLKICSGCKLISFCDKACQLQFWPIHKSFCKKINQLMVNGGVQSVFLLQQKQVNGTEKMDGGRLTRATKLLVTSLPELLERDLTFEEFLLLSYPKHCAVCFETDPKKLNRCFSCKNAALCIEGDCKKKSDENPKIHNDLCDLFRISGLCQREITYITVFDSQPRACTSADLTGNLFDFIEKLSGKKFINNPKIKSDMNSFGSVCQFSFTATIVLAMDKLGLLTNDRKSLDMHVVGSKHEDPFFTEQCCALFYSFMPNLETLKFTLVGPEVNCESSEFDCFGKKVQIVAHKTFYEDVEIDGKPDLIMCFNSGFTEESWGTLFHFPGFPTVHKVYPDTKDTDWVRGMKKILKTRVPFGFTSYCKSEFHEDSGFVNRVADHIKIKGLTGVFWTENPYRDLRPFKNFELSSNEPLYYSNQMLMLYNWKQNMAPAAFAEANSKYLPFIRNRVF